MGDQNLTGQLTEAQKACLRLVSKGMSSKEIAQQIGLSPRTVDTYLTQAAQSLSVSGRREASRRLAALEIPTSQNLLSQSAPIDPVLVSATSDGANAERRSGMFRRFLGWIPPVGGERYELGANEKILQIVKAAIIAAAAFGSIVATGTWLQTLFT